MHVWPKLYDRDPNAEAIWGAIDKLISESRRVYLDDPAYVVTLKEVRHSKDASSLRYQYDARSGTHRICTPGTPRGIERNIVPGPGDRAKEERASDQSAMWKVAF